MSGLLSQRTRFATAQAGSLLVELSLVLTVAGVIAALAFGALSNANKTREQNQTVSAMAAAEQAIRMFALRENRLPCPDRAGQGYEGLNADGVCPPDDASQTGELPYVALNMERPVLSAGTALRYGIAPGLGTWATPDLLALDAEFGVPTISLDVHSSQRFITQLIAVSRPGNQGHQTLLAGPVTTGEALDCSAGTYPAFALSGAPANGTAWCFSDIPNGGARALSVSTFELVGLLQAQPP